MAQTFTPEIGKELPEVAIDKGFMVKTVEDWHELAYEEIAQEINRRVERPSEVNFTGENLNAEEIVELTGEVQVLSLMARSIKYQREQRPDEELHFLVSEGDRKILETAEYDWYSVPENAIRIIDKQKEQRRKVVADLRSVGFYVEVEPLDDSGVAVEMRISHLSVTGVYGLKKLYSALSLFQERSGGPRVATDDKRNHTVTYLPNSSSELTQIGRNLMLAIAV